MSGFDAAFKRTMIYEGTGAASKHPHDPGGLTRFGVSQRAYPDLDIASLTLDQARVIYRRDFWDALRLDEIPERIAETVFDFAVNSGVKTAARALQRAIGVEDDGMVGPVTIAACRAAADVSGVVMRVNADRLILMTSASGWPAFGRGWARRVANELMGG